MPSTAAGTTSAQVGREADFCLVGFYSHFLSPGAGGVGGEGGCRTRGERSVGWAGAELEYLPSQGGEDCHKVQD